MAMNRILLWLLTLLLFAAGPLAEAQQTKKVPRIGLLSSGSPSSTKETVEAFRQGLRERGYVEGQNIVIEYRYAGGLTERLPNLAAELVQLKVDCHRCRWHSSNPGCQECYQNHPHRHDHCYRPCRNRLGR